MISRELAAPFKILRRGKSREMIPEDMERKLTMEEKLTLVLPKIRDVDNPHGSALWRRFGRLEEARHSTVHIKVKDQYAKNRDSLFVQMLSMNATEYPAAAAAMIRHYFKPGSEPRWFLKFSKRLDAI